MRKPAKKVRIGGIVHRRDAGFEVTTRTVCGIRYNRYNKGLKSLKNVDCMSCIAMESKGE